MKKKKYLYIIASVFILLIVSCESKIIKTFNLLENLDSIPPKLKYIESNSPYSIEIEFDERLNLKEKTHLIIDNYKVNKNKITYYQNEKMIPGEKHYIKLKVEDLNGNSTFIESFVFTKNTDMADILISEVSTKGTSKNCDKVEIVVTKSGSLAGIVVSDGFNNNYNDRCVLPDVYANEGDFYVISFKNQEDDDMFISENKKGLSSNNGCVLLLDSPSYNAKVIDCIIYSNKKSENCEGFASEKTLETAKSLSNIGLWEKAYPLSETAINSTYETSTRTINRKYIKDYFFIDSNSNNDFYITVTRGDTFGYINTKDEYLID